ncbi:MAG: hypothetical protein OQK27_01210 [Gammaproteobacteria bacterium]|nr:hypothetical protein [Gammaproteobacteria bacterium]
MQPHAVASLRALCSNAPMATPAPFRFLRTGPRPSRPGLTLLLGLLLALAQFTASAHGLSHLSDHPDEGGTHTPACEWCLNLSQLGAAVPTTGLCLPARDGSSPLLDASAVVAPSTPFPYRYHSRAPPHA